MRLYCLRMRSSNKSPLLRIIIFTDAHILTYSAHQDLTAFNLGLTESIKGHVLYLFVLLPLYFVDL